MVEAAVIGIPDKKWTERPLLIAVPKLGQQLSSDELLSFFQVYSRTNVKVLTPYAYYNVPKSSGIACPESVWKSWSILTQHVHVNYLQYLENEFKAAIMSSRMMPCSATAGCLV